MGQKTQVDSPAVPGTVMGGVIQPKGGQTRQTAIRTCFLKLVGSALLLEELLLVHPLRDCLPTHREERSLHSIGQDSHLQPTAEEASQAFLLNDLRR